MQMGLLDQVSRSDLSSGHQDSQAGSGTALRSFVTSGSVSQGVPVCLCLWTLLAEVSQPIIPECSHLVGSGRAMFIAAGLAPRREKESLNSILSPF